METSVTIKTKPSPWCYAVYVIGSEASPVKIGYARDPEKRLMQLQMGSHKDLYILHRVDRLSQSEAKAIERKVHKALSEHHVRGEWYDVDPDHALNAIHDCIDTRVSSARFMAHKDLRGYVTLANWSKLITIAHREITVG